jgi:hypothetical protein
MTPRLLSTLGLVACVLATLGCDGRKREILAYADETCACPTFDCTLDVEAKYQGTLVKPETWLERHFTSSAAESAMVDAVRRANACQQKLEPPKVKCGGPEKVACPNGDRCIVDPQSTDGRGVCGPYKIDVQ